MNFARFLICLGLIVVNNFSIAQNEVNTKPKNKSPRTAGILSAVLPGAGQFYNGKYWKIPIVYAGIGAGAYLTYYNWRWYSVYRNAFLDRLNGEPDQFPQLSNEQLKQYILYYRTNMEWALAFTVIVYGLNILDAVVDAHLSGFDVSDRLAVYVGLGHVSLRWHL